MTGAEGEPEESDEDLFENAPCGYLSCRPDGKITRVNRTFEAWTGFSRDALLGRRFRELLAPAGRIYHETHYIPVLQLSGSVREIALEIVRADGTRLPALINSTLHRDESGRPTVVRTTVIDATDRRAYERELLRVRRRDQEVAQQLQRSLLCGELATSATLEVDFAYVPGQKDVEVGGDWYDAFWLQDGVRVALVVGDVVGRGIAAAAAMGQLRSAIRALASTGLAPGPLLDALDVYVARHSVGRTSTVVYVELELDAGHLRYACAGHPPPIVIQPGQQPRYLWDGRSPPLHAFTSTDSRPQAAVRLEPGGVVLLYTDGLVERRMESLDVGLDRLLAEITRHDATDLGGLLARVVRGVVEKYEDDICLLAARRTR